MSTNKRVACHCSELGKCRVLIGCIPTLCYECMNISCYLHSEYYFLGPHDDTQVCHKCIMGYVEGYQREIRKELLDKIKFVYRSNIVMTKRAK